MERVKLRKLVVADQVYLWRRRHVHSLDYETSPCCEEIVVYQEGRRNSPLRLLFKEDDNKLVTDNAVPGRWLLHDAGAGICWFFKAHQTGPAEVWPDLSLSQSAVINFNRPAVIARLVMFCLAQGWQPATATRPFELASALKYLNAMQLPA